MIVAVATAACAGAVQVSVHDVANVVAVLDGRVSAAVAVDMCSVMVAAVVVRTCARSVGGRVNGMLVKMLLVLAVQVACVVCCFHLSFECSLSKEKKCCQVSHTVVDVARVVVVLDRQMTAGQVVRVRVGMLSVLAAGHFCFRWFFLFLFWC